jgi:hypothetical protein
MLADHFVVCRRFTLRVAPTYQLGNWFGALHLPLGFLQHGITFFLHNKSGTKIANQQLRLISGDIPRWGEKTQYFVTLL